MILPPLFFLVKNMKEEKEVHGKKIFKKKGWKLSSIPYNYVVTHKNDFTYWTTLDTALRWIQKNSTIPMDELKDLAKGCSQSPPKYKPLNKRLGRSNQW